MFNIKKKINERRKSKNKLNKHIWRCLMRGLLFFVCFEHLASQTRTSSKRQVYLKLPAIMLFLLSMLWSLSILDLISIDHRTLLFSNHKKQCGTVKSIHSFTSDYYSFSFWTSNILTTCLISTSENVYNHRLSETRIQAPLKSEEWFLETHIIWEQPIFQQHFAKQFA